MKVKSEREVTQSCLTLSDLVDCSPPGSSIRGIFQARVLEWGAIAFSRFGHYLLGNSARFHGVRSSSHRTALPFQMSAGNRRFLRLPTTSVQFTYKWEGPMALSLGSINLLEWLTEFRSTFTYVCCCYCLVTKSCLTLLRLFCSPPGSSVHGILQTKILEWVAISFSRSSS